jgi:translation elongation factor EF-Ts
MISRLRHAKQTPISKTREATLSYLNKKSTRSSHKKTNESAERKTSKGLVAVVGGYEASGAVIELLCETNLTAKNELFRQLAQRIAFTAAWPSTRQGTQLTPHIQCLDNATLLKMPLLGSLETMIAQLDSDRLPSVQESILDATSKLGEEITLGRVLLMESEDCTNENGTLGVRQVAGYVLGGEDTYTGRIASLVLLEAITTYTTPPRTEFEIQEILAPLSYDIARQIVHSLPTKIEPTHDADTDALLAQPWLHDDTLDVNEVLSIFASENQLEGVRILDFARIEVGEQI